MALLSSLARLYMGQLFERYSHTHLPAFTHPKVFASIQYMTVEEMKEETIAISYQCGNGIAYA